MARIKRRKHLSAILHRVKADQFANREKNAKRARQVDIEDGRARMGSFVPHHIKFRDPND